MKIVVIGGGAAGFFSALAAKQSDPDAEVVLIEKTAQLLSKVRISGGGRCNVTHSCFDPRALTANYPRGSRELLGPFHRFQPKDTIEWFELRGVRLKTESDGRMFPTTDSSETIIECLLEDARRCGVKIWTKCKLKGIEKVDDGFRLDVGAETPLDADRLIMASGSSRQGWEFARQLGHEIVDPVPSLFTFNVPEFPLVSLAGVSVNPAKVAIMETKWAQTGPLLITHWGFSGPAALKLSAFGARTLAERQYEVDLLIDWLPGVSIQRLQEQFEKERRVNPNKQLKQAKLVQLPKKLWGALLNRAEINEQTAFAGLSKGKLSRLLEVIKKDRYGVKGKTTNKEEFVTCGGVKLSEVDFKTMESKKCEGLYFCGEILDVDGITGGFNFQNAWTTGWIAGCSASSNRDEL